jgi:hypothetical protein
LRQIAHLRQKAHSAKHSFPLKLSLEVVDSRSSHLDPPIVT